MVAGRAPNCTENMRRNLRALSFFVQITSSIKNSSVIRHRLTLYSGRCLGTLRLPTPSPQLGQRSISKLAFFSTSIDGRGSDFQRNDEFAQRRSNSAVSSSTLSTVLDILRLPCPQQRSRKLEECTLNVTSELVEQVLSRTRNDWEAAFTFFLWAGKRLPDHHLLRDYHSMIAILGKFRKFDTAWTLINDMRSLSMVTPHTLVIMIRKYAAVHDVARALNVFYGYQRFKFKAGLVEFQGLLSALCRYKNVKDAEHLLFCNESVFPLCTKSFNIILNGWCNVVGDVGEGRRIWSEMERRKIPADVYSYSSIMSSYSKANKLNAVVKLYDRMKYLGVAPDRKVYNAVIHALAKKKLLNEAHELMKTMEEKGVRPDCVTYNSLIVPLCRHRLVDEAKLVFNEMIERGFLPSVRTYHAFFRALRSGEEVFELMERMCGVGCVPSHETYMMLIRKLCRWRQLDDVFKLWKMMAENGLDPDRSSYTALIHGLFLNGRLDDAHRFYLEMKAKDMLPEPATEDMIQRWLDGKIHRYKLPYDH